MAGTSGRTSKPEQFGSHEQGQPDAPEEATNKPGHDGQPPPSTGPSKPSNEKHDSPDKKEVENGSDADSDDSSLGV